MPLPRLLAVAATLLTGASLVAGAWQLSALPDGSTGTLVLFAGLGALAVGISVLGLAVARRVPENVVGPLLASVGTCVAGLVTRQVYFEAAATMDPPGMNPSLVAVLNESACWLLAVVALLLLCFPSGTLPSRRWRFVPPALVVTVLANQAYGALGPEPFLAPMQDVPHPFATPPAAVGTALSLSFFAMLALLVACVAGYVLKLRRASGTLRNQLRWPLLPGVGLVLYPFVCLTEIVVTGHAGWFSGTIGLAALVGLPIAITVAMLRHDLYDVDKALASALTYALLSLVLVGVFAATSLLVGLAAGSGTAFTTAAATAACAAALAPMRSRLQRAVDRRLRPASRAVRDAVAGLQQRIHVGESRPEELEEVLRDALRDRSLRVGYRVPGTRGYIDAAGAAVPSEGTTPVRLGGEQIGVLTGAQEAPLREAADAAATLVEVARLRLELAAALTSVEASRARLVLAGDRERRRLERDLHDGAQQRLLSLGMALRVAQRDLDGGGVDVHALLDAGVEELGSAVAELRQIAQGLRPSSLDDGLDAALEGLTQTLPIPVDLHVDAAELPDDIATTAYYVACEALSNAVKHADAERISVRIAIQGASVRLRISDDGRGGAAARPGSGLTGLADRVAAAGGSLAMLSPRGRGTTVEAVLPCGS